MAGKQQTHYEIDMCNGPILSKMLRFSIPLMCSSVLQLLFNAADIVVVGRWAGDNSLAAVGSNTALIGLLTNLFVGLAVGANTLAAKYYGARDRDALHRVVHTSILLSIISGLVLTVVGVFGARTILIWMQTPENVLDLATLYLRIYFLGMTATMVYKLRRRPAAGGGRYPAAAVLPLPGGSRQHRAESLLRHRLQAGRGRCGHRHRDLPVHLRLLLVLRCMVKDTGPLHLDLKKMRLHPQAMRQILRIGLPAGFQGILFSLSNVVIQSSVNTFGEVIMAGNSAAANIEQFVYVSMNAMYQATISFTSQNYGAGNYHRIRKIMIRAQGCVLVVGLVLGNAATLAGRVLLSIYTTSPPVIEGRIGADGHRLHHLCPLRHDGRDGGRPARHRLLHHAHAGVPGGRLHLRLLWIATIFQLPQFHTIQTIYWSYPISWAITFGVHVICFLWAMKRSSASCCRRARPRRWKSPHFGRGDRFGIKKSGGNRWIPAAFPFTAPAAA